MKREVSNSMSIENDPVFDVNFPLCSVCLNSGDKNVCKAKGEKDLDCKWGDSYKCDKFKINKDDPFLDKVIDKIEDANK